METQSETTIEQSNQKSDKRKGRNGTSAANARKAGQVKLQRLKRTKQAPNHIEIVEQLTDSDSSDDEDVIVLKSKAKSKSKNKPKTIESSNDYLQLKNELLELKQFMLMNSTKQKPKKKTTKIVKVAEPITVPAPIPQVEALTDHMKKKILQF